MGAIQGMLVVKKLHHHVVSAKVTHQLHQRGFTAFLLHFCGHPVGGKGAADRPLAASGQHQPFTLGMLSQDAQIRGHGAFFFGS